MKKRLKNVAILLGALLIGAAALAGCGGQTSEPEPDPDPAPTPTLNLDVTETTLFENAQVTLTATLENSTARVVWSSDDMSVATVKGNDKTALVTAENEGECAVTAKAGDVTASCAITVVGNPYYALNLPMNKLILNRTGDHASLKVILNDDSIDPEKLVWTVSNEEVCTVEAYLTTAYITAGKKGDCNLTVSYDTGEGIVSSSCAVTVRNTVTVEDTKPETTETLDYYAFTAAGVRSEKTYRGLSNAINALVGEEGYGAGSYIATTSDPDTVVYTYKAVPYHFLNRSEIYHGFDTFEQVDNGQAGWWSDWSKQIDLYKNDTANMLQLSGQYAKSYYYRPTDWSLGGYAASPSDTWAGWRSSVYAAAGACAQYSSWADDNALGLKGVEQTYDLSSAIMTPSLGSQNVYAEIWTSVWYPALHDDMPYYGAYFDAGTQATADALADGAKGYWYAFEGKMDREGGLNCSNPSVRTLSSEPIGYSVWNKAEGRWESQGLTVKLRLDYSFPNFADFAAGQTSKIFVTVTGEQDGETLKAEYVWDYGERYELGTSDHMLGICYGVAFTPNAPLSTEQYAGFYKNAEIPDLYNGGSWKGVKQVSCTGFGVNGEDGNRDMSFTGGSGAKFRAVWGKDVCTYTKNPFDGSTVLDFQY